MNGLKLLVLPGWANSGPGHWQTFWEKSLPNSRRVLQDNWREPHKQAWVKRLNEEISKEQEPLVLVCHSLGCWLAAHWAIEHPDLAKTKVRFALLVAPPDLARTNDELWAGMKVFAVSLFKKKKTFTSIGADLASVSKRKASISVSPRVFVERFVLFG
jgi:predicted alpha/beta hydrolase family esterase